MDNCFEWYTSESSPRGYPTEILRGYFVLNNGIKHQILPQQFNQNGWGNLGSDFFLGSDIKPVPAYLTITYLSFMEDKVYSGEFFLEKDKLIAAFKSSVVSPLNDNQTVAYDRIVIGLAPLGHVSIWLHGDTNSKEVAHFTCQPLRNFHIADYKTGYRNLKEYTHQCLREKALHVPNLKSEVESNVLSRWSDIYRKKIALQTEFHLLGELNAFQWWFFNGESVYQYPAVKNTSYPINRMPEKVKIHWQNDRDEVQQHVFQFSEKHIFDTYTELSRISRNVRLVIQCREFDSSIQAWMIGGKQKVQILEYSSAEP